MSTVLLLSPAVQPCLRSPRRFWCADRGQLALIRIPAFPSSFLLFAWLAIINTTHTRGLSCERRRKRGAVRHVHDIKTSRLRLRQRLKTCCVTGKTQANYPDFCGSKRSVTRALLPPVDRLQRQSTVECVCRSSHSWRRIYTLRSGR